MRWSEQDEMTHIEESIAIGDSTMYEEGDAVLKKDIRMGICDGFVVRRIAPDHIRVKWQTGFRSTLKAASVVADTAENRQLLEGRYDKRTQQH